MKLANRDMFAIPEIIEQTRGDLFDPNARKADFDPKQWSYSKREYEDDPEILPDLRLRKCNINRDHGQYLDPNYHGRESPRGYWAHVEGVGESGYLVLAPCDECARQWQGREERYEGIIDSSRVPHRFLKKSDNPFAFFKADTVPKKAALAAVGELTDPFSDPAAMPWAMVLAGGVGTGKTSLAAALMDEWAWHHASVRYFTERDLYREIRSAWAKGAQRTEEEVLRMLIHKIDLLVIDDLGTGSDTDGEKGHLYDVLDGRYGERQLTLICSNLSRKELASYLGTRLYDRLRDGGRWVSFDWASYRGVR